MECFVYDYDHNAPNVEHLEATHERMFRIVRAAHPDIPILMMCRPRFAVSEDTRRRMEVIRRTYENAKAAGDENVYLLTDPELMAIAGYDGMVDGVHPNDLGFFSMAQAVVKVLKPLL
jgi:lysophospholipase L1-like esterase